MKKRAKRYKQNAKKELKELIFGAIQTTMKKEKLIFCAVSNSNA